MLTRSKPNRLLMCARHIAIPAVPCASSSTESQKTTCLDDELWKGLLKNVDRMSLLGTRTARKRKLPVYKRQALSTNFFSSQQLGQSRKYSTRISDDVSSSSPKAPETLFNSSASAWDHVFENIDDLPMPPMGNASPRQPDRKVSEPYSATAGRSRRQAMTAREITAFNDMFNMIFDAVSEQKKSTSGRQDPLSGAGIGSGPDGKSAMGDLLGKLRRHSKKYRWSAEEDEELDRKREQMELCETDQQLLEWATREVFDESRRYEEAARQAVAEAGEVSSAPVDGKATPVRSPLPMQPPAYPHLLALLMRAFRDKYGDPHLALAMFEHAKQLSIASYVFGCTVPAYNELLETRWRCFRDLRGVVDTLQEMRVNGIEPDSHTRRLVEKLRREVGERNLWQEESDINTGEVFEMLSKIEKLSAKHRPSKFGETEFGRPRRKWTSASEKWKMDGSASSESEWKFGDWNFQRKRRTPKHPTHKPLDEGYSELAFD